MPAWNATPKSRRLMQIGLICFVVGLLSRVLPSPAWGLPPNLLDFFSGLLLGVSIATLIGAMCIGPRTGKPW